MEYRRDQVVRQNYLRTRVPVPPRLTVVLLTRAGFPFGLTTVVFLTLTDVLGVYFTRCTTVIRRVCVTRNVGRAR